MLALPRFVLPSLLALPILLGGFAPIGTPETCGAEKTEKQVTKYARFQSGSTIAYGIVEGDLIRQIDGDLFGSWKKTDKTHALSSVRLLVPTQPTQVLAMAGNYKSHLKDAEIPPKFLIPQPFFKTPSCLVADGEKIVIPPGTEDVHYEAELVIVIGKRAKNVSEADALSYVFGVTCGNDVSARDWQKNDVQWWRAKGSDTFGPVGPVIVSGLNYDNLMLELRLNGETKQKQSTKDFIHNISKQVSAISACVALNPGDLIFTGTPGNTAAIKPGDVVEVELEGVGVLKNGVVAGK
jgi:2-keto-4-pentenoate hydratase/2-oxohepta-3-ene-1,7-dioic acid hydratase in catechol pathway